MPSTPSPCPKVKGEKDTEESQARNASASFSVPRRTSRTLNRSVPPPTYKSKRKGSHRARAFLPPSLYLVLHGSELFLVAKHKDRTFRSSEIVGGGVQWARRRQGGRSLYAAAPRLQKSNKKVIFLERSGKVELSTERKNRLGWQKKKEQGWLTVPSVFLVKAKAKVHTVSPSRRKFSSL